MHLALLLQMASDGMPDRVAIGSARRGLTTSELARSARRVAAHLSDRGAERIGLIDVNSEAVPIMLFGAALAGTPFVPINYRLTDDQLRSIVVRCAPAVVVVGDGVADRVGAIDGIDWVSRRDLLAIADDRDGLESGMDGGDPDDIAVLLYTSGTTGEPKAAVLRHRNLASYILSSVEFGGSDISETALVSVPPYHVAGVSSVLSSTYSGRRVVYLEQFDPEQWFRLVRDEAVTHSMVVPTMLSRILDVVEASGGGLPSLRSLSYGGGPMPVSVIERAMELLPGVGFVNAYGLTETSSTIALLGPDEHREALASDDPVTRARLTSVGRPLPSVEVSIRDSEGNPVPTNEPGEVWVRGEQVSGEYLGRAGIGEWFCTRDAGHLDDSGFLYLHGRLDDVIVRGGENLSPGAIEDVLMSHPSVAAAAAVGIPDTEWGEKIVAAVVLVQDTGVTEEELRGYVRAQLRSTMTPERIQIRSELPFNETGKLLRRVLREELEVAFG